MSQPRILEIRRGVLEKNDVLAQNLRQQFTAAQVLVVNLVSSPGAGKTMLLEKTLWHLRDKGYRAAALVGDLATDNDAQRLARSGAPVRQIVTGGNCHLEAEMIATHLRDWRLPLAQTDFLFIENVGNLVCPASYDLGEHVRVVLLCVTEGEDKPLKYPVLYHSADVALLTKMDIAAAVEFDRAAALGNIQAVRPGMIVLETSAKTEQGLAAWLEYLVTQRQEQFALA
jgi:hydrogenase nickel incorporation protein HypB